MISVFVVYGFSGGAGNKARAFRTDALITAILKERESSPIGPCAIVGDINCDPEHLKSLQHILCKECWTDVGAVAGRWNQTPLEHTCTVAGATMATRRDYIFTNNLLTPRIRSFRGVHANGLPTHATPDLMIETANFNTIARSVKSPLSFFVKMRGDIVGADGDPDSLSKEQQMAWDSKVAAQA